MQNSRSSPSKSAQAAKDPPRVGHGSRRRNDTTLSVNGKGAIVTGNVDTIVLTGTSINAGRNDLRNASQESVALRYGFFSSTFRGMIFNFVDTVQLHRKGTSRIHGSTGTFDSSTSNVGTIDLETKLIVAESTSLTKFNGTTYTIGSTIRHGTGGSLNGEWIEIGRHAHLRNGRGGHLQIAASRKGSTGRGQGGIGFDGTLLAGNGKVTSMTINRRSIGLLTFASGNACGKLSPIAVKNVVQEFNSR